MLLGTELSEAEFNLLDNCAAQVVVLDNYSEDHAFDSVVIPNRVSAKRAVRYLVARGHRKIGYLACDFRIHNFRTREQGFLEGLTDAGLEYNPAWRVELGTEFDDVRRGMSAWLADKTINDLPTAFFSDSDMLAAGSLRAFIEAGFSVPDDISLIGFDDGQLSAFSNPPITTVHVPRREMGELAVRRLVGNIRQSKGYTCTTQVNTHLVERQSVREL